MKVIAIDDQDRVKLSRKALLREQNPGAPARVPAARPLGIAGSRHATEAAADGARALAWTSQGKVLETSGAANSSGVARLNLSPITHDHLQAAGIPLSVA